MKQYSVRQLAKLAGVSVRTLHHYDQIGLLKPSSRSAAKYRYYTEGELFRLQQILFYRELDVPLAEIRKILDDPRFEPVRALRNHRRLIGERLERLRTLLETIDKTILELKGEKKMASQEELYQGFSPEEKAQHAQYAGEARKKYDPVVVDEVNARVGTWPKEKCNAVRKEWDDVIRQLATLKGKPVSEPAVQALVARHHANLEHFYRAPAGMYRGLAQLYVDDPRFRQNFDKFGADLADYLKEAIEYFCAHTLSKRE